MNKQLIEYRMPAEWEPQKSVWLIWPYNQKDWPGLFNKIPEVYAKIIFELSKNQIVNLLINKNASLAEKGKTQMQNIYDYTKKLVDGGVLESSQLDEANLMLLQTASVVNELKMNEELSMIQLKSNIGYPLDSLLNIVDDF